VRGERAHSPLFFAVIEHVDLPIGAGKSSSDIDESACCLSVTSHCTREGYLYCDCGSLTAITDTPPSPQSPAIASHKSVVKVAIPHCRGKWFPTTATRTGSDRGRTCKDDADLLSNSRGRALHRISLFGLGLVEKLRADITGFLKERSDPNGAGRRINQAPGVGRATPESSGAGARNALLQTALRRPLTKLMIRITNPTTRSKWINPPPTWRLKPRSHKITRMTKIVQRIGTSGLHSRAPERESDPVRVRSLSCERV